MARHGLPVVIATHGYEHFPPGRIVFHRPERRFIAYADRKLHGPAMAARILAAFGLTTEAKPLLVTTDGIMDALPRPRGSQARGLMLHKLLEEVLTGEVMENQAALAGRAKVLAGQLDAPGIGTVDSTEVAGTVLRRCSCRRSPRCGPAWYRSG